MPKLLQWSLRSFLSVGSQQNTDATLKNHSNRAVWQGIHFKPQWAVQASGLTTVELSGCIGTKGQKRQHGLKHSCIQHIHGHTWICAIANYIEVKVVRRMKSLTFLPPHLIPWPPTEGTGRWACWWTFRSPLRCGEEERRLESGLRRTKKHSSMEYNRTIKHMKNVQPHWNQKKK